MQSNLNVSNSATYLKDTFKLHLNCKDGDMLMMKINLEKRLRISIAALLFSTNAVKSIGCLDCD